MMTTTTTMNQDTKTKNTKAKLPKGYEFDDVDGDDLVSQEDEDDVDDEKGFPLGRF